MTDQATDTPAPQPEGTPDARAAKDERATKSFWVGVGIGSAALAAALLYSKRPRGKSRT